MFFLTYIFKQHGTM